MKIAEFELASESNSLKNLHLSVQVLGLSDWPLIDEIQSAAKKHGFSPASAEQIKARLPEGGSLGAFFNGRLAGMLVDFVSEEYLTKHAEKIGVKIHPDEKFRQYLYVVNPEFRGFKITERLFDLAQQIERKRNTTHVFATVAPHNVPSIKVLLRGGMAIRYAGPTYGDSVRFITYKNLQEPLKVESKLSKSLRADDIQEQQALIAQGYVGTVIKVHDGNIEILYFKTQPSQQTI